MLAVDREVADEDVARVCLLVFKVEVCLVGFAVAADEKCGEAYLSVVDFGDGVGSLDEAAEVGEAEMGGEE